jgi:carboxylesterase type B
MQYHTSDTADFDGDGEMEDYVINFINHLNPNGAGGHPNWPQYKPSSPNLLTLNDGAVPINITQDTFRQKPMEVVTEILYNNPY